MFNEWLPKWLSGKESAYNAGEPGSIPGSGRSLGEGNSNPLQYSCLGNPRHRGAWRATVDEVEEELDMTEQLNKNNKSENGHLISMIVTVHRVPLAS